MVKDFDYLQLTLMPLTDAYQQIERWFGVVVSVSLALSSQANGGSMLWWTVDLPYKIHQRELCNPPRFCVPYLSPSIASVDDQIATCLVGWCEETHKHLKAEGR